MESKRKTTSNPNQWVETHPPATDHQPPTTSHRSPATDHQPPATSHRPPTTSHLLHLLHPLVKAFGLSFPVQTGKRTLIRRYIRWLLSDPGGLQRRDCLARRNKLRFRLDLGEEIDLWIYLTGWWEKEDCVLALNRLKPGDIVVDAGANIGTFSLLAAAAVGSTGQVHAFEPNPRVFDRLTENARLNHLSWLKAHAMAVGSRDGESQLFLPVRGRAGGASLVYQWLRTAGLEAKAEPSSRGERLPAGHGQETVETPPEASIPVTTVRLDTFLLRHSVPRVDLIKIDTEGIEPAVLEGAVETIQRCRPYLMVECNTPALESGGIQVCEFFELIRSLGYAVYRCARWRTALRLCESASELPADVCNLHCVPFL